MAPSAQPGPSATPSPPVSPSPANQADELRSITAKSTVPFRSIAKGPIPDSRDALTTRIVTAEAEHAELLQGSDALAAHFIQASAPHLTYEQGIFLMGEMQPGFGFDLEVLALDERPEEIVVHSVVWEPQGGPQLTQRPFHYVATPKTEKPFRILPPLKVPKAARPTPSPLPAQPEAFFLGNVADATVLVGRDFRLTLFNSYASPVRWYMSSEDRETVEISFAAAYSNGVNVAYLRAKRPGGVAIAADVAGISRDAKIAVLPDPPIAERIELSDASQPRPAFNAEWGVSVITDAEDWRAFWENKAKLGDPPPLPGAGFDFSAASIVAVIGPSRFYIPSIQDNTVNLVVPSLPGRPIPSVAGPEMELTLVKIPKVTKGTAWRYL